MPRKARVSIDGGFYLVSARSGRGLLLFREDSDYASFSRIASPLLPENGLRLLSWCLLPGSAHLLLCGDGAGVKRFMRLLLGRYSRTREDVRGSGTGLYGGERYRSRVFTDRAELPAVIRFLHSLPVREGAVLFADAWNWSSLRGSKSTRRDGLKADPALSELTGGARLEPGQGEPEPDWPRFLLKAQATPPAPAERLLPADPAAILAREFKVHRSRLVNPRGREQQALRHAAFRACRDRWGMNYSEIARTFGVTPAAVINAIRRFEAAGVRHPVQGVRRDGRKASTRSGADHPVPGNGEKGP